MKKMEWSRLGKILSFLLAVGFGLALLTNGIAEQVPMGGFQGRILMKENGRPLPGVFVSAEPRFANLDGSAPKGRVAKTDENGRFSMSGLVAGYYLIDVTADAHRIKPILTEMTEGRKTALDIEMAPIDPYLDLYNNGAAILPGSKGSARLHGFCVESEISLKLYKIDLQQVQAKSSLYSTLSPLARVGSPGYRDPASAGTLIKEWKQQASSRDIEGIFAEKIETPELQEGVYWLATSIGGLSRGTYFNVTRLAVVTKHDEKGILAFAADLETGKPISGAQISTVVAGKPQSSGVTNGDGLVRVAKPQQSGNLLVFGTFGKSNAFTDFYEGSDERNGPMQMYGYTDRPIYRPGDEVNFKGVGRIRDGDNYRLPPAGVVDIEIRDSDDSLVERFKANMDAMGAFSGKFNVNREAKPGTFSVTMRQGDSEGRFSVSISAYQKPEFNITITPEKKRYIVGDKIRAKVKAEYYFGGPVIGAKVESWVDWSTDWGFDSNDELDYPDSQDYYFSSTNGYVSLDTLETDENGEAWIEFDATAEKGEVNFNQLASLGVSVSESSGRSATSESVVKVARGKFDVSCHFDDYIASPGNTLDLSINVKNSDDTGLSKGRELRLVWGTEHYVAQDIVFVQDGQKVVTITDSAQPIRVPIPIESKGNFVVKGFSRDDRGNTIQCSTYLYVLAEGAEIRPNTTLDVLVEHKQYEIGDDAKVLVMCSQPGGKALLTVEAENILFQKVVDITDRGTSLTIPVTKEFSPNVVVSVCYVRNRQFFQKETGFRVNDNRRKLGVSVTALPEHAQPGDPVTVTVNTQDEFKKPVSADVSIGVVDEAIYALAEDNTNPASAFYPRRYSRVRTYYSFAEIYLDGGDKAPTNIKIRKDFRDTAFWNPLLRTDVNGNVTVKFNLPDNLTTWRATAIGFSAQTAIGKGTDRVVVSKPVMARIEAPRFFVANDAQDVTVHVTNDTGKSAEIRVQLQSSTGEIVGDSVQRAQVEQGHTQDYVWQFNAKTTGEGTLTAKAWIVDGPNDGVEHKMTIRPLGRTYVESFSGDSLESQGQLRFVVRPNSDPKFGRMRLWVAPTLSTSFVQSVNELIDFPYGCVEQTVSRMLPAVLVRQAVLEAGLPEPEKFKQIPQIVHESFTRLQRMQTGVGGWGWWENDTPSPFMTAMVLEAYFRANQAGFSPNAYSRDRALRWAEQHLKSERTKPTETWQRDQLNNEEAYLIYAMALWGKKQVASQALNDLKLEKLSVDAQAYLALAANQLGLREVAQQYLQKLHQSAVRVGQRVYWKSSFYGNESTSLALRALTTISPKDSLVMPAMRYLLGVRQSGMWRSTRDTTFALLSLIPMWKQNPGEFNMTGSITILLNGKAVKQMALSRETLLMPEWQMDIPLSELRSGENTLQVTRTGGGPVYYCAELRQSTSEPDAAPLIGVEGLRLTREYFSLEPTRLENGSAILGVSKRSTASASKGQLLKCRLTIDSDRYREFLLLEDPLLSGISVTERTAVGEGEDWTYMWSNFEIYDDRVATFLRSIPKGKTVIEYNFRAETAGTCHALPAILYNMYEPFERTSTASSALEIRR